MDMVTFLQSRGIRTVSFGGAIRDKHLGEGWVQMPCPICGGDKLWLGYNIKGDYFNCFGHGYSSKKELFRRWFPDDNVFELLTLIDDHPVICSEDEEKPKGHYDPPIPQQALLSSKSHVDYIRERGLDPVRLAEHWRVTALRRVAQRQYCDRLFIPVFNRAYKPVSWLTRTISAREKIRYLTAPKDRELEPIKSLLYGEQFVTYYDTVIICEGVFDAFRIGCNALATFGKKLTLEQKAKIKKYQRRIICFDSEPDTQRQAEALAVELMDPYSRTENICLDAPDPGSARSSEIEKLLRYADLIA